MDLEKKYTSDLNSHDKKDEYVIKSKQILEKYKVNIGDNVKITSNKGNFYGIIMPRYESFNDNHIVIKLKSGYNMGILIEHILSITKDENTHPSNDGSQILIGYKDSTLSQSKEDEVIRDSIESKSLPRILLISTGGTIASKIDYRTGGVTSLLTASEIYSIFPEISKFALIFPEYLFNEYSENITPQHWSKLSERITHAILHENYNGIIISHGTDTMHYTSSAISFALQNLPIPVVFVGSQRSSDRPSSDAFTNLMGAIKFISETKFSGVFVCMHHTSSDNVIACHLGTRLRKNHTSKRNAFQSLDSIPFALIDNSNIIFNVPINKITQRNNNIKNFISKTSFDDRVFLLKFYTGFDPSFLDCFLNLNFKIIILEGTGLGHINKNCFHYIKKLISSGIIIFMTSQCIYGRVQMTVYDTGRDLLDLGVIPLSDMSSETAVVKAMWALGNSLSRDNFIELMRSNISNEVSNTSLLIP